MTTAANTKLGALRGIQPQELKLMLSWRNAPAVRANMFTRHKIQMAEHLAWWARMQARSDQQYFMYEFRGAPSGVVALNGVDETNRNSSWGYYAAPKAPKGTGSRMLFLALEHAFNGLRLHKLCGEVLGFNKASIGLHERFGFKVEGVLREQHKVEDGFVDVYRLGLLASEWAARRDDVLGKLIHANDR